MCLINLTTMEPPAHRACTEYAVKACPFLTQPRRRRNDATALPEGSIVDGAAIERNPGCVAVVEAKSYHRFDDGKGGWLIRLVKPTRVDWWAHGRQATRDEIMASIESGYPILLDIATKHDGPEGVAELEKMRERALHLLPAA
jgi:hypothetical protein